MGPPREHGGLTGDGRIDIINRADGITFAEAIADGESFNLEGCEIPAIGRGALIIRV